MTQPDGNIARMETIGRRIVRLPLVLLLTVGLLMSLIHCAGCGMPFSQANSTTVVSNTDNSSAPDTPEQQLPCHSGHCLSHVTTQSAAMVTTPADLVLRTPDFGREQFPSSAAGLPLFKPPRA
jgi:hypothetical protein